MLQTLLPLLLAPQDTPLLHDELPRGWQGERLDFPLTFAPDLGYEGYEELRFAPGMFDANAADYWSYLFGIRLVGEHAVDEAFVEDFLTQYYEGLCTAVAAGRFDLSKHEFVFDVERRGGRFHARMEIVDSFVTGKPLELRLELDVDPGVAHTDLFAIASPAADDAAVWTTLRKARDTWVASRLPKATLNHVYFVVDEESYAKLAALEYLRGPFAAGEVRDTVRRDMSYSGLYLYGDETYLEFLPAGAAPQLVEGGSGIAFGFDRPGELARAQERLTAAEVMSFAGEITRAVGEAQVPWFDILGVQVPHVNSKLSLFAMEYDPGFLGAWRAEASDDAGIARREVLSRYAATCASPGALRDITAVHMTLDEAERERLAAVVRAWGWQVEEQDGRWVLDGPGVDFFVTPSDEPGGLTGLDLRVDETLEAGVHDWACATLEVQRGTAKLRVRR